MLRTEPTPDSGPHAPRRDRPDEALGESPNAPTVTTAVAGKPVKERKNAMLGQRDVLLEGVGVLRKYSSERGYGFVDVQPHGPSVFVHASVADGVILVAGFTYKVIYFDTPRGPRASRIEDISESTARRPRG